MKIYVATSWKNSYQPEVVEALRAVGHTVYDFRHPPGGDELGFTWRQISPDFATWSVEQYAAALDHPVAVAGHASDMRALVEADLCVLVLPSGRSASWEYGFHNGMTGRMGVVHSPEPCEPELMYAGSLFSTTLPALVGAVQSKSEEPSYFADTQARADMREIHFKALVRRMARIKRIKDGGSP